MSKDEQDTLTMMMFKEITQSSFYACTKMRNKLCIEKQFNFINSVILGHWAVKVLFLLEIFAVEDFTSHFSFPQRSHWKNPHYAVLENDANFINYTNYTLDVAEKRILNSRWFLLVQRKIVQTLCWHRY